MEAHKTIRIIKTLFITMFFIVGCSSEEETTEIELSSYKIATITHFGFDFSEDKNEDSPQLWDGSVNKWQPGNGEHSTYKNNDKHLWWSNSGINNGVNATKYFGSGTDLSTITSVPANSWDSNPSILPLLENILYIAKCRDGYVKFRVLSTKPNSGNWATEVEYYFSKTTTFDK
jgi:hypothetical protein